MAVCAKPGHYFDTEVFVPYRQVVGNFVQDQWGATHAILEIEGPVLGTLSSSHLCGLQGAMVGILEALPEEIVQVQFSYSTCGDYRNAAHVHASFASEGYPLADFLRHERAERIFVDCASRRIVMPTVLCSLSCVPTPEWQPSRSIGLPRRKVATATETAKAIESLELAVDLVTAILAAVGYRAKTLSNSDFAAHLYRLWNPFYCDEIPLRYESGRTPINDAWLVQPWSLERDCWQIGSGDHRAFHGFVSLTEEPQESVPGIIERLTSGGPVRDLEVTQAIRRTDKVKQATHLRFQLQRAVTAMKESRSLYEQVFDPHRRGDPAFQQFNVEDSERALSLRELLADLLKGTEFQVLSQLTVHTWASTREELARRRRAILARLSDMGSARGEIETFPTAFVTQATFPAACCAMPRWRRVRSRMASDLTPVSPGLQTGEPPVSLFETESGGLATIDLFSLQNVSAPIAMVCGGSGAGKSFLVNQLLVQHLVGDTTVLILDVGGSYTRFVEAFGGSMFQFDSERPFCFNPLQVYGAQENGELVVPTPGQRGRIVSAIESLIIPPDDPRASLAIEEHNLLDTTIEQCFADAVRDGQRLVRLGDVARKLDRLQGGDRLLPKLQPFLAGKEYGAWIDGPTSVDLRSRLVCFDLQGIRKDARLTRAMATVIINYIHEMATRDPTRRKIVVMDELWQSLNCDRLVSLVVESWKTFRKFNAVVIGSTQSLGGDIADSPVSHAIIDNTQTWFLLSQGEQAALKRARDLLNLTDGEVDILARLQNRPRRDGTGDWRGCLLRRGLSSSIMSGEIRIRPTPFEYWLATTRPDELTLYRRSLRANGGDIVLTLKYLADRFPRGLSADGSREIEQATSSQRE